MATKLQRELEIAKQKWQWTHDEYVSVVGKEPQVPTCGYVQTGAVRNYYLMIAAETRKQINAWHAKQMSAIMEVEPAIAEFNPFTTPRGCDICGLQIASGNYYAEKATNHKYHIDCLDNLGWSHEDLQIETFTFAEATTMNKSTDDEIASESAADGACGYCGRNLLDRDGEKLVDGLCSMCRRNGIVRAENGAWSQNIIQWDAAASDEAGDEPAGMCPKCLCYYLEGTGELCGDCVGELQVELTSARSQVDALKAELATANAEKQSIGDQLDIAWSALEEIQDMSFRKPRVSQHMTDATVEDVQEELDKRYKLSNIAHKAISAIYDLSAK